MNDNNTTKAAARAQAARSIVFALAAVASFTVGACFTGYDADGLPCDNDRQCGPGSFCLDGLCGGVFFCDEDRIDFIDGDRVCDGTPDCADGQDEAFSLCPVNMCEDPANNLEYVVGNTIPGVVDPLDIGVADIMGSPSDDAVVAGNAGDYVKVVFDLDTDAPQEFFVGGSPGMAFDGRSVVDVELGDANGDNKDDIVVLANGDTSTALYVYQSRGPQPPELFGEPRVLSDLPELIGNQLTIHGFELGRLNNDSSTDIVSVVDIGLMKGNVLVGIGDSSLATGSYFLEPEILDLVSYSIGYNLYIDSVLADMDGNSYDDLVVAGSEGGVGKLWTLSRNGDGTWREPVELVAPVGQLALGRLAGGPGPDAQLGPAPDLAILQAMTGKVQTFINMGGMLMPTAESFTIPGDDPSGLVLADLNCDGNADFIVNVANPARVLVFLGDGQGSVISDTPVIYESEGTPRGGLGVAFVDGDQTPDIFSMIEPGNGLMSPRLQVLVNRPGE